ncbi:MAG: NUDIX hydrolase [candidate division Zixibacteria bacterium]|nr:NUDIX hydrolase [candidate division Zixibacteria bacterium]
MNDDDLHYLISGPDASREDRYKGYRYCPRCRTDLRLAALDERERPQCPSCGFIYYQNPAPAAGAVLVQDDRILLVRRSVPPRQDDWCLPAGFIEWNEHPQQTAVRELKEETGLEISIRGIFDIFFGMDDPRTHAVLILYLADVIGGEAAPGDDAAEVRWFDFDHLPPNIAFQAHRDALALYRRRYLTR